jgi:hypothetical protein
MTCLRRNRSRAIRSPAKPTPISQSTKPSKVKERVADLDLVRGLYHQLSPALQAIALSLGGSSPTPTASSGQRSFSLRAEAIPSGIYTFSPLLLTSITGSKTTWSMCCSRIAPF